MEKGDKLVGAGIALKASGIDFSTVQTKLMKHQFDIGCMRPYFGKDGNAYINILNTKARGPKDPQYIKMQVANATLTYDAWKEVDAAVQAAARIRTPAVSYLRGKGLSKPMNGFGKTIYKRQRRKEKTGAEKSIGAVTQGNENGITYDAVDTPLYIAHDQFSLEMRQLAESQNQGTSLDTDNIQESTININELVEGDLLTNTTFVYGGATVYSAINHPNLNAVTLSQNWDASGTTGEEIASDVRAIVQAARNDRQYGDGVLFTPTAYDDPLDVDFKANGSLTVRERLLKITGIADVVTCDKLPANTVVWIQLSPSTFQMIDGLPMTTIQWETSGGLQLNWKIITIQIPLFKPDYAGRLGLVVLS